MNLILFEPGETTEPLPCGDPRAVHILEVLRRGVGDSFDAGLINGPRGKGRLVARGERALTLSFEWGEGPRPADPLGVIVGMPRPQTARKILQECAALGVAAIHFFRSEKGESGYGGSKLWSTGEWRRHLVAGAEQAFDTRLPEVTADRALADVLGSFRGAGVRIALDPYEGGRSFKLEVASARKGEESNLPVVLAFGPERGWSAGERDLLRQEKFELMNLGPRILRTETAVVAAVAVVKASRSWPG